jgi:hypothetical protein
MVANTSAFQKPYRQNFFMKLAELVSIFIEEILK